MLELVCGPWTSRNPKTECSEVASRNDVELKMVPEGLLRHSPWHAGRIANFNCELPRAL